MAIRFTGSDSSPTPDEIAAFEARVRTRLPEELRTFLGRYNGGRVEPCEFAIRDRWTRSGMIQNFLSLATLEKKWSVLKNEQQPRMPPEHIPIAKCEGGITSR
jgi:hypothetical protein